MFKKKSVQSTTPTPGKKELHQITVDPFVRVLTGDGRKVLMLDSCMELDLDRKLAIQVIHAQNPVFTLSHIKDDSRDDLLVLTLSMRELDSKDEKTLLSMRLDLQGHQAEAASINGLVDRIRGQFLTRLAAELASAYSPEKSKYSDPTTYGAIAHAQTAPAPVYVPTVTAQVSAQPVAEKRDYKRFVPWLAGVFALMLLVVGLNSLLSKKERDPFAGVDPHLMEQIESSGLHGSASESPSNVTEQTLKAMGLDPGKAAANMNCLAN